MATAITPELSAVVIGTGLVVGVITLGNANWVWFKKQVLGLGGIFLASIGLILTTGSVWGNIQIQGSWDNFKIILEQAKQEARAEGVKEGTQVAKVAFNKQLVVAVADAKRDAARATKIAVTAQYRDQLAAAQSQISRLKQEKQTVAIDLEAMRQRLQQLQAQPGANVLHHNPPVINH